MTSAKAPIQIPELHLVNVPIIVVDLDGTLVLTDTLWESVVCFVRTQPFYAPRLFWWLLKGKAGFKAALLADAEFDATALPYSTELLEWLKQKKEEGYRLILATGANLRIAEAVATHLQLFDMVLASEERTNLTGEIKLQAISRLLDGNPYQYIGNSSADIPVWKACNSAIVAGNDGRVTAELARLNIPVVLRFNTARGSIRAWVRMLRVHQWIKNVLVLVPALTSHRVFELPVLAHGLLAFILFSIVASAIYIANDLLDLPADRMHPDKRNRPIAAGIISIPAAIVCMVVLLASAGVAASMLPAPAGLVLMGYAVASLVYSAYIKKLLIADVVALTTFYTIRVLFGGLMIGISLSVWTLAFSVFTFFSLAASKRINDLAGSKHKQLARRAYSASDAQALTAHASASATTAVLVLILYLNSPDVTRLYSHPQVLWCLCPLLLYWMTRVITLASRGQLPSDPILMAARDRASYLTAAAMLAVVAAGV